MVPPYRGTGYTSPGVAMLMERRVFGLIFLTDGYSKEPQEDACFADFECVRYLVTTVCIILIVYD